MYAEEGQGKAAFRRTRFVRKTDGTYGNPTKMTEARKTGGNRSETRVEPRQKPVGNSAGKSYEVAFFEFALGKLLILTDVQNFPLNGV